MVVPLVLSVLCAMNAFLHLLPALPPQALASPLTSTIPTLHHKRVVPELDPVDLTHVNSVLGLAPTEPTCNPGRDGVTLLWSDCVHAFDMMEDEDTARVTGYVGDSAIMTLYESWDIRTMDFLGIPRLYWYESCIIEISSTPNRHGQRGLIVNSDIAHKNAVKITAAGVLIHCLRRSQVGGFNRAGQHFQLRVSVIALEEVQHDALTALNLARQQGYTSAMIHLALNSPSPNVVTETSSANQPAAFDHEMDATSLRLPVAACLSDGVIKCGWGVECRVERVGGDGGSEGGSRGEKGKEGLKEVLWGAPVEAGWCDWEALRSGLLS